MRPLKSREFSAGAEEEVREFHSTRVTGFEGGRVPLEEWTPGDESDSWQSVSKKMSTSVLQPQGTGFYLNELGS